MTWNQQERRNAAGRWESHCGRKGCDWSAPGDYRTRQQAREARWAAGHRTWHWRQEQARKEVANGPKT